MTKTNKAIDLKGLSKSQLQVMASDIRSLHAATCQATWVPSN